MIGRGRVGAAFAARLEERGLTISDDDPDLVLLCVPDSAIREVARTIAIGPWIAHVSGATPLAALDPHVRRFSVHPLQTFTRARGPEQIDGAWGAITADSADGEARARWLAETLGLRAFTINDSDRVIYHAGAAIASNYLVTLYRAASQLMTVAGAPPEALVPLMIRTIENGFELTGPIARGDWQTVDAHIAEISRHAPELLPMYRSLASSTALGKSEPHSRLSAAAGTHRAMKILRTVAEVREALGPLRDRGPIGLVPTMGALHKGHVALFEKARSECATVVASLFVNPTQFNDPKDLAAYPRDEQRDAETAADAGVDFLFAPAAEEIYPPGHATWVDVEGAAFGLEGEFRPGHFRGVATVCLELFSIVQPDAAYFGQKDAQQVAVVTQMVHDLNMDLEIRVVPTVRDADGLALSSRNARLLPDERTRALAIPRALEAGRLAALNGHDPVAAAKAALIGLDVDYVAVANFSGHPTLAIAARAGRTRLIDNVRLDTSTAEHRHGE